MKTIYSYDLKLDVLDSNYVQEPIRLYLKDGRVFETEIDYYTHDYDPFTQYIEIGGEENYELINFNEIEKIELL